jgi:hypothetical protein
MASSGMLRRVPLVRTDLSGEISTSIIRVTRIGELGRTLTVNTKRRTHVIGILSQFNPKVFMGDSEILRAASTRSFHASTEIRTETPKLHRLVHLYIEIELYFN